jgi:hypothetical protein
MPSDESKRRQAKETKLSRQERLKFSSRIQTKRHKSKKDYNRKNKDVDDS